MEHSSASCQCSLWPIEQCYLFSFSYFYDVFNIKYIFYIHAVMVLKIDINKNPLFS